MIGLIQYHKPVDMRLVHDFVRELRGGINALRNPMLVNAEVQRTLDDMQASHATRSAFSAALIIVESGAEIPVGTREPATILEPIEKEPWSPMGVNCLES